MTTEQAFLADVIEHPDDDAPRLVFADWLDDHGRHDRAEFVRLQCRLARLPADDPDRSSLQARETELLERHGRDWAASLRGVADEFQFRRGFVEAISIWENTEAIADRLRAAFTHHPLRAVQLEIAAWDLAALSVQGHDLLRLKELYVYLCTPDEDGALAMVLELPQLRNLDSLLLNSEHDEIPTRALLTATSSASLASLTELGIAVGDQAGELPSEVLDALATADHLTSLRTLHLLFAGLDEDLARRLFHSAAFSSLTRLHLMRNSGSESAWRELIRSPQLKSLGWLNLHNAIVVRHEFFELRDDPLAQELRDRFGDALTFDPADQEDLLPTWHGMTWR